MIGDKFVELSTVIQEAVKCRNHYVHGDKSRVYFDDDPDIMIFLTATLEFIFAVSDLIEAGWDAKTWSQVPTSMSHPFGAYRITYAERLKVLKEIMHRSGP